MHSEPQNSRACRAAGRLGRPLVTAVLLSYGACSLYNAATSEPWWYAVLGGVSLVGAAGIAFDRPWSRFIVYFLSFGFTLTWAYFIGGTFNAGHFHAAEPGEIFRAVLPGVLFVSLALLSACLARCQFVTRGV